jgi:putative flavoprotein involved in K+ transport
VGTHTLSQPSLRSATRWSARERRDPRRGAGYYIETGASKRIIDGRIKLASSAGVERINERSVTLSSGATLPADLIVFATGYGDMNQWAAQLISPEVAENVGKV